MPSRPSNGSATTKEGPHHEAAEYVHSQALGRAIAKLREERTGLSRFSFAHTADIHRNTMNMIEHGETSVGFLMLVRIAKALDVTMPDLMSAYELELAKLPVKP